MTIIISNRPTAIVLLLSASLLSGCAVGPEYQSPDISVTSRFLGQDGIARREIQSKAELQTWWAAFDDPMLALRRSGPRPESRHGAGGGTCRPGARVVALGRCSAAS